MKIDAFLRDDSAAVETAQTAAPGAGAR